MAARPSLPHASSSALLQSDRPDSESEESESEDELLIVQQPKGVLLQKKPAMGGPTNKAPRPGAHPKKGGHPLRKGKPRREVSPPRTSRTASLITFSSSFTGAVLSDSSSESASSDSD